LFRIELFNQTEPTGVTQMKQELRQIYDSLASGKLSQKEALEKIKAIKLQEQSSRFSALLATPVWRDCSVESSADASVFAERHIVLCELPNANVEKLSSLLPQSRCLLLQAGEQKSIAHRYSEYALACFERIQTILRGKPLGKVLVQIVIAGNQEQALLAGLSGLLKTAMLENPQLTGQCILVPAEMGMEELARHLQETAFATDTLIRYDQGVRTALRWQEVSPRSEAPAKAFKDHGVYLITGGLGGLGILFAKEILKQAGQARVVLMGRSALNPKKQSLLKSLAAAGQVSYRQVDLGSLDQVSRQIAAIQEECGHLNGILHCAGTIADNFILKKTREEFNEVLSAKVTGTYNLDLASKNVELDFFVLFSSIAGAMGNVGQADYAAANGFMDQFAAHRNGQVAAKQRHGQTRSINWGLWQDGGMQVDAASQDLLQQATGIRAMQTATGMEAFYRSMAMPNNQMLVLEGDVARMRSVLFAGAPIQQTELSPSQAAGESIVAGVDVEIDAESLVEKTQDYLRKQLSELLRLPSHKIDPQAALENYGIDSILAMKLTAQLEKTFGALSKTLFFEYQTIHELTKYFIQFHQARLGTLFAATANGHDKAHGLERRPEAQPHAEAGRHSGKRFGRQRSASRPATDADPIAIIGLSGRYPEAVNIEAYWNNLREGKDCIVEVPRERWDWREYFSEDRTKGGHHYSKWGGFIAGVDEFDPLFFNIAPKEAKFIDPQERLFLQHAWMAIEDAGYTRASLQVPSEQDLPGQVGVYVGLMYSEYQLFGADASAHGQRMGIAGSAASIANRVSYALNLHGPSMTLDTMCSSSLTAIHTACQDLKLGRTSLAIAGGVNVSVHPNKYLVLSTGQFISSGGHCQSFGKGGDGYIPGEGVGVVILKRLSEAERDGDHIYGIIRGSALNHGGKTNGYSVPNPQAQSSVISRTLAESKTDARHISYIEAHGTGTKLGDPIEIAALSKAFQHHTQETEFCLIGSAKSNIGHCESAAGIAGLTKVLLQMQHQQIVPSLHSTQLNPHIDFPESPFVVNQELREWEQPEIDGQRVPRIAGISSFGAGGSNAHMIVEEYPEPLHTPMASAKVVILLSARTADQLQQKVRDLLDFVRPRLSAIDLAAMAYTLQVGREAMEERLGLVVNSVEQLVRKLEAYAAGAQTIEDAYQGQVKRTKEALALFNTDVDLQQTIDKWMANRKVSKLLELWVKGLDVDWSKLYGEPKPRRMSLPTYPFAKERYWIDVAAGGQVAATAVLHPLLHSNTSDLSEQRYSSTFTGEEFFLADHRVKTNAPEGEKALPEMAYLEMARAAMEQALPVRPESTMLELRNVAWAQPMMVSESKQVSITLLANNDDVDFEIYSLDGEQEIIHCQGLAVWNQQVTPAMLDIEQIKGEMGRGQVGPEGVYAAWARMGALYGPGLQSITVLHVGRKQVLAQLQLPDNVKGQHENYVLHPSLMNGALQGAVGLLDGLAEDAGARRAPFALESLRIFAPCNTTMVAWVRYAPGSQAEDKDAKLDIDLCDEQGNVCVQMRGVSWQPVSQDICQRVDEASDCVQLANVEPERLSEHVDVLPAITASIRTLLANELQMKESDIDEHIQFVDLGLDSVTGVTWIRKINAKYQVSIEAIKLYSYPTLAQLSRYVKEEAEQHGTLSKQDAPAVAMPAAGNGASPQASVTAKAATKLAGAKLISRRSRAAARSGRGLAYNPSHSIAVIGMSGRFPLAKNLDEFWQNIAQGRNCITQVQPDRWDVNAYYRPGNAVSGKTNCKWLGALEDYDRFDPLFFNISPKEAESMDPQQRLILQACWHSIEDAGYNARSLSGVKCGVFVGCTHGDYHLLSREQQLSVQGFTGDATSILAGRISYFLDLQGPCLSIDTACSSALVAIANACDSLIHGSSDLALAGGVYVMAGPEMHIKTAQAGMLSSEGKCFTFDQRADGFVPGEGVGVVMLKRLADAQTDQDIIYGVIEGWGINQDGKTNGITAPNLESQTRLEQEVYDKYQIDPASIQLIEAHGTGTKLGDPIEVEGLKKAFKKYTQSKEYCALGSVKSNIGHCLTAAGIAGFIKLILALQHKQLPPTINFERLNEHIDLKDSPFYVNNRLQEWKLNGAGRRRAAINSLGFSGTNAHLVVGEYQPPADPKPSVSVISPETKIIFPLSARTAEQLRQKAHDLLDFVRPQRNTIDLASMAYTLQVGREAMEERLGLVVSSVRQLVEKLEAYVAGEQGIEDAYQGQVKRNKEALSLFSTDGDLQQTIDKWIANRKVSKLLELWAKGLDVDWSKLYGEVKPQRMSLPKYPFARDRYWIDAAMGGKVIAKETAAAVLHPLLHSNTSDLAEQSYSSSFSGEEFFLKDHQVDGQRVLPASAYLEMARAAVQNAARCSQEMCLELRNVAWAQPMAIRENKQVSIVLLAQPGDAVDFEVYSQDANEEIVHCQGSVAWSSQGAMPKLDMERLKNEMIQSKMERESVYATCARGLAYGPSLQAITNLYLGNNQVLAQLRLPGNVDKTGSYVMHPSLMEGALQAAARLNAGGPDCSLPRVPLALESLRIFSSCSGEMVAWVRLALGNQAEIKDARLDIDLCDERGNVCIQMRGISWQPVSLSTMEPVVEKAAAVAVPEVSKKITTTPPVRKEIVLFAKNSTMPVQAEQKKPKGISLAALRELTSAASISSEDRRRPSISLSSSVPGMTRRENAVDAVSSVRLFDDGGGIFSIQIEAGEGRAVKNRMAHLLQALERVQQEMSVKVLKLGGLERCFRRGTREDHNQAVEQKLYQALLFFPCPVIAVLPGDAIGASLMAAALCDFMVCNEDATYAYTDLANDFYPTTPEVDLFVERFGTIQAQDFLYVATAATGKQLRAKGWTGPIVPGEQVEAYAQTLAATLATKSQEALRLLKQHLTRDLAGLVRRLQVEAVATAPQHPSPKITEQIASPSEHLHLHTPAENVVVIKFKGNQKRAALNELIAEFGQVLEQIRTSGCKAIVLASEDPGFLTGAEDVIQDFQRLLMESAVPIVAALNGNAKGHAWLLSQFCDACVYSRTGLYSAAEMTQTAASILIYRLGKTAAQEVLLTEAQFTGEELARRIGTLLVSQQDHVLAKAEEVASFWAKLPQAAMAAWKKRTAAILQEKVQSLPAATGEEKEETAQPLTSVPMPITLQSNVVSATVHPEGIVVVKMEDREAKNMFSEAFLEGMSEVFTHIERTPGYKVVVLTGYDSYFSSGGTKESLLAIQEGKAKFTDYKIFQLPLDCKLPVIAAMQGHGIGAGWSLGMFADLVLLSEESRYVSPYMNYGFTPGAGATWSLADKMGQDLARESLLTGEQYAGSELKARGLRLSILPRAEVNAAAMALARQIARGSRRDLISLKQRLTGYAHQALEETYRLELSMHEKTFVGQSDTLAQIHNHFHQEMEASSAGAQLAATATPNPSINREALPVVAMHQGAAESASTSADSDVLSAVTASLKTLLAEELHLRESDIAEDVEFVDLGLDSISGVTWLRKINDKYHTSIEATKVYSYPTLTHLSRYVKKEAEKHGTLSSPSAPPAVAIPVVTDKSSSSQPQTASKVATKLVGEKLTSWRTSKTARFSTAPASQAVHSAEPIAVIGMSGRFPKSKNLDEFWQNIVQGRNCVTQVPPNRWDMNRYYDADPSRKDKTNSKWMGALDDIDCFDPLFFRISPQEAEYIDPQHRLFLQESYKAIEDAGYSGNMSSRKCGVYLGISTYEYALLLSQNSVVTTPMTSNSQAIAAARIAYYLNLKGPAIALDTACSSSLVAIHLACQGLLSGETDMALAGGVSAWLTPGTYVSLGKSGGLSTAGQCKAFDDAADGIVLSEAVGAIVLKRLKDAQADNDIIHGVILGSGINQDGRTNGMTAPSVLSQYELERSVYEKYKIDPGTITYVETHGAGSALGDPIELEALATAFREKTDKKNFCALGSVKSNIGHPAAAAGVSSFIKAMLSLRHRTLAPVRNIAKENSHFDFKNSPFYVCRQKQAWEAAPGSLRRAAVSGFGFSGTNVHLVIEEYAAPAKRPVALSVDTNFIVPISARTPEQLRQKAVDMLEFIRARQTSNPVQESTEQAQPADLAALAYTLQVGREAMEERLGFVVSSVDQLAEKLTAYINGAKNIEDARQGRVDSGNEGMSLIGRDDDMQEAIDKWIARKKYSKLLDLWIKGLNLDWNKLYGDVKPSRISLPAYPFAKERCWISGASHSQAPDEKREADVTVDVKSIEDIINKIDDGAIETDWAIQELRLVSASTSQSAASLSYRSQSKPLRSGESNGHHRG
jgi:acyl transferase domain-containing protein/enoyl-CoA hydratase/carnithine racemase